MVDAALAAARGYPCPRGVRMVTVPGCLVPTVLRGAVGGGSAGACPGAILPVGPSPGRGAAHTITRTSPVRHPHPVRRGADGACSLLVLAYRTSGAGDPSVPSVDRPGALHTPGWASAEHVSSITRVSAGQTDNAVGRVGMPMSELGVSSLVDIDPIVRPFCPGLYRSAIRYVVGQFGPSDIPGHRGRYWMRTYVDE